MALAVDKHHDKNFEAHPLSLLPKHALVDPRTLLVKHTFWQKVTKHNTNTQRTRSDKSFAHSKKIFTARSWQSMLTDFANMSALSSVCARVAC